ncbi:MAG: hypothetical protein MJZ16_05990 [Bacteroidales bacterium]|nr:hypothetical protein [Bacteroidales bacterium]
MRHLLFIPFFAFMFLCSCTKVESDLPEVDDVCTQLEDAKFKDYCYKNFDIDHDGKVSITEAESVTSIAFPSASYKGIGYFKNLTRLEVRGTFKKIDVSKNTKLEFFSCSTENHDLEAIDLSKCLNLKKLYINDNKLKSLDVTKCSKLYQLECYHNNISSIDLSRCADKVYIKEDDGVTIYYRNGQTVLSDHNNLVQR